MKFKVGDEVYCNLNGIGKITSIEYSDNTNEDSYPIFVSFIADGGFSEYYIEDGKLFADFNEFESGNIRKLTKLEKAMK